MRVQAGSDGAVAAHIFLGQRLSCNWQRWDRLHALAINFRTCWETKNCSKLQSIARFVDFNCVLMQLIAPCNRALSNKWLLFTMLLSEFVYLLSWPQTVIEQRVHNRFSASWCSGYLCFIWLFPIVSPHTVAHSFVLQCCSSSSWVWSVTQLNPRISHLCA